VNLLQILFQIFNTYICNFIISFFYKLLLFTKHADNKTTKLREYKTLT